MMGERTVAQEALFYEFSLEWHVPAAHLLRSIDRATPAEIAAVGGGPGPSVRAAALAVAAADPLLGKNADSVGVWHDTFSIPAGSPFRPLHVFLHIAFTDPVQVGRFLFHCHILEHEDKGMKAPFEVLNP